MDDLVNIVGERRTYSAEPHSHAHPYAQLILPVQGILSLKVQSTEFDDINQRVFFVDSYSLHSFYSKARNQFLVLDIPSSFLPPSDILAASCHMDERWEAVRTLLLNEVKDEPVQSQAIIELCRYSLHLLRQKESVPVSVRYIIENYHKKITVEKLAVLENYNTTYYCDWFKGKTGFTPMNYIKTVRMENAKKLLEHTDYSILQIAQQVGYEYQSTFTRVFHQNEGITPGGYRDKIRKLDK